MHATPQRLLIRHFFKALFDFGFLSDAGAESFKKLLLGMAGAAIAFGLLLVRIMVVKYIGLARHGSPLDYQHEITADHAFLIAVPMWIVAFAIVLVGHALFPDETDYRILMAQPISRAAIFRAKLAALGRFGALFVAGAHAALLPMLLVTTLHRHASTNAILHTLAFEFASLAAATCAALAMVAIHGLLVLAAPRARLAAVSTLIRSGLVCALVLSLPLLVRLPAHGRTVLAEPGWMWWTPPFWFTGLERAALGSGGPLVQLAPIGAAAFLLAAAVAAASYVVLYRRFDRVILRPRESRAPARGASASVTGPDRHPVRAAVRAFVSITLRRSVLHQGIVVALAAVATGFVVNGIIAGEPPRRGYRAPAPGEVEFWLVSWAPFVFMFVAAPAIRLALSVPIELRANWIFRMTEAAHTRADAIAAAVQTMVVLGVVLPAVVAAPFQFALSGVTALPIAAVTMIIGWLFVEILLEDWRRVPFTCSYVPGKAFVPQMIIKAVAGFFLFTGVGSLVARVIVEVPAAAIVVAIVAGLPALGLLIRRRRGAPHAPLIFEDQLPTDVNTLRLSAD